jgi:CheY-like chemotaxis protein
MTKTSVDRTYTQTSGGHRGVLVSSIHNDTRYMIRVLLEMWGYRVFEACGEEETLSVAESAEPEVILLDTSKLFFDDIEILSAIRRSRRLKRTPVIVLTGYAQPQYEQSARDHGASGFLVKPFDLDILAGFLGTAAA